MIIGVPKEIKDKEFRVGMTPAGVQKLTTLGHLVLIQSNAGLGSGISDAKFQNAGARIISSAQETYEQADLIVKVKEPLEPEYPFLRKKLNLFTYLHLAPLPQLTDVLLEKKVVGIAYETVQEDNGYLPLLAPMSAVAGRMAIQVGAHFLEKEQNGRGILLSGVPGVAPGRVTILGSGTVATHAAEIAVGLRAEVTMLGRNLPRLAELDRIFKGRIQTRPSDLYNLEATLAGSDLVVGAVLVAGANAPKLITRQMLSLMRPGAVIVDVAIDQGGCAETSRPTTHSDPTFTVDGITHYCVANIPGAVPHTSTYALTNATLPFVVELAELGVQEAARKNKALARGINVYQGKMTNRSIAAAQGKTWTPFEAG